MMAFRVYCLVFYGFGAFSRTTVLGTESPTSNQDMYLTALKHSHLNQADVSGKEADGYSYPQPQPQPPDISYLPSIELSQSYNQPTGGEAGVTSYNRPVSSYGAPDSSYGAPPPDYGTPASSYGPPGPNHHAPQPVYGPPPSAAPIYVPAPVFFKPVPYPHYLHDHWPLLAKLKAKLNLFTIGKLLLKLVIFKKIIKFISFICLLLIVPKLKDLFKGNMSMSSDNYSSESSRTLLSKDSLLEKRLDELYEFAWSSLHKQS